MAEAAVIDRFTNTTLEGLLSYHAAPPVRNGRYYHSVLSNFYPCRIKWEGLVYPTLENAYQASKSLDPQVRGPFARMTAGAAKKAGAELRKRGHQRADWHDANLEIMGLLITQKFMIHEPFRLALLSTDDAELIEGNDWNDDFWGMVKMSTHGGLHWAWRGDNHLGKTLMSTREVLRRAAG